MMRNDPLLRAFDFIGLRRSSLVAAICLGAAGALSALGLAALSAWLITRAWQMPPVLYLSVAVTAVRALGISRALFRYLERLASHRVALDAMASARGRVYRALAGGSGVGAQRSELLARTADDVDEIGDALVRGVVPMAVGAVTGVAAVVIMAVVSPLSAVVLAGALLISGVLAPWWAARASATVITDGAAARQRTGHAVTTALWHGPELVVARRRGVALERLRDSENDHAQAVDAGMARQAVAASMTPVAMLVSVVAAAVIAVDLASGLSGSLAGASSSDSVITPMLFGVLILLPLSAFETTGPLTDAAIAWQRGRQAGARVMALVDGEGSALDLDRQSHLLLVERAERVEASRADPVFSPAPQTLIARGLQWGHDRSLGPDGGIDLDLAPGARLIVVGRSGAGKSTLAATIAGQLRPLAGSVDSEPASLPCSVAYFAEEGHLFSTSLRENLRVARGDATDVELIEALTAVGLGEWLLALPDGLDTDLVGGGSALSGGQRRRILLARAVVHPARVVVLDEPTEHVDSSDAPALLRRILDADGLFGSGRTVIVVTHQNVDEFDVPIVSVGV
ncbi:ATP-binding cassette, subfamily C, CydC [Gordonia malaquae]|uniref:ABC transporter permease/ATP-binding protein CydC n=2 Tax=Gordonia malaquae TaxID=410332 RepID=M3UK64_GORML|nr:ABC transporter permease/ATP-binding protein CydC [Gordonia malaquae NBRC 108250]SEB85172.1 ATP-binding cassette, subfamily C, CydC [Gordonia malaquae]